jgi:rubrerythrin
MRIVLRFLELHFRKSVETIELVHVNFFWGKIGAGKSSIARLFDYCLGADIQLTPALQLEFVQAVLSLDVEGRRLTIYRERESSNVVAAWREGDATMEALIPARRADGVAVPGTSIEVLSDLFFHLAERPAPMVRKGRRTAEPGMVRLSLRDLVRFCYIDQDEIDSDFFRLDLEGDSARRAKSVDAMRFILGYHQDQVATLEAELQELHEQKMAARAAAEALTKVLEESGFSNPAEIDSRIEALAAQRDRVREASTIARQQRGSGGHAVDSLRDRGRSLSSDVQGLEEMLHAVKQRGEDTERHLNELKMLSVRFSRTKSARTLLAAVDFTECPRCTQSLPGREETLCPVCGQPDSQQPHEHLSNEVVEADLKSRLIELQETHRGLTTQERRIERQLERTKVEKALVDQSLSERMRDYDSSFLSQALEFERQMTVLEQQVGSLLSYRKLPERLSDLLSTADTLQGQESGLRAKLARERDKAFKDRSNLEDLERLFLDCLVRSAFPGVNGTYKVTIDPRTLVPEVAPTEAADFAVTSFANMGSGGMKSIFKACYALAIHRLAAKTGADLPSLVMLDSAMKNVSERENRDLFHAFYRMVYELAADELSGTQFILIDKELLPVPEGVGIVVKSRHMAPGSLADRPLVPYYEVPDPHQIG